MCVSGNSGGGGGGGGGGGVCGGVTDRGKMAGSGGDKNADEEPANSDDGREGTRSKKRKLHIDGSGPDVYDELMLTTTSEVCAGSRAY